MPSIEKSIREKLRYHEANKRQLMDKDEAERLARAIRLVRMDWIEVQGVEYNASASTYEVLCTCRPEQKELLPLREAWAPLLLTSPRQWIILLTRRGGWKR